MHKKLLNGSDLDLARGYANDFVARQIFKVYKAVPSPAETSRESIKTMLAPIVACLLQLGCVPILYMRGNNGSYDATYLHENTETPRPYRRG